MRIFFKYVSEVLLEMLLLMFAYYRKKCIKINPVLSPILYLKILKNSYFVKYQYLSTTKIINKKFLSRGNLQFTLQKRFYVPLNFSTFDRFKLNWNLPLHFYCAFLMHWNLRKDEQIASSLFIYFVQKPLSMTQVQQRPSGVPWNGDYTVLLNFGML